MGQAAYSRREKREGEYDRILPGFGIYGEGQTYTVTKNAKESAMSTNEPEKMTAQQEMEIRQRP